MERRQAGNPSSVARYTNVSGLQTCDATTIDRDARNRLDHWPIKAFLWLAYFFHLWAFRYHKMAK